LSAPVSILLHDEDEDDARVTAVETLEGSGVPASTTAMSRGHGERIGGSNVEEEAISAADNELNTTQLHVKMSCPRFAALFASAVEEVPVNCMSSGSYVPHPSITTAIDDAAEELVNALRATPPPTTATGGDGCTRMVTVARFVSAFGAATGNPRAAAAAAPVLLICPRAETEKMKEPSEREKRGREGRKERR
jgi:hypothetical protein